MTSGYCRLICGSFLIGAPFLGVGRGMEGGYLWLRTADFCT